MHNRNIFDAWNGEQRVSGDSTTIVTGFNKEKKMLVESSRAYRNLVKVWLPTLLVGVVVLIVGQAVSGARFGMAWAEGVVGQQRHVDDETGTVSFFNEMTLSTMIYEQTIATVMVTIVLGLVLGTTMQRFLLQGVGCLSALLFFAWVGLLVLFVLPLLIYASMRSIFNQDDANEDCSVFGISGYEFAHGACKARFWTFLVGGSLVLTTLASITFIGTMEAIPNMTKRYSSAYVYNTSVDDPPGNFWPGGVTFASAGMGVVHGFRSPNEKFFNYKTGISSSGNSESNRLLYAPSVRLSSVVAR